RALGLGDTLVHTVVDCTLQPGDVYLLCSDGLNKPLAGCGLAAVLAQAEDPAAVAALVAAAHEAGGPDNISVILIRCIETNHDKKPTARRRSRAAGGRRGRKRVSAG